MYFTSNDGSENTFDTIELKKTRILIVLSWKSKGYILLNVRHPLLLSYIAQSFLDIKWE